MHRVSPILVGRQPLLDRLVAATVDAANGKGSAHVLVGPPGTGKSTLARHLAGEVAQGTVVVGRTSHRAAAPLRAVSELAIDAIGKGADPSKLESTIFAGALHSLIGGAATPVEVAHRPLILGEAVRRLASTCRAQPVVAIVEDLHWADAETLATLDYLVDHLADGTLMVVGTLRDAESPEANALVARWGERRAAERIVLPQLDRRAVQDIIAACLEVAPPIEFVDAVWVASDGNPFLAEEFLHDAIERGHLTESEGSWTYQRSAGLVVPPTFQEAVELRLRSLRPELRDALRLFAIVGRDIDMTLLGRLGVTRSRAEAAVEAATASQLVEAARSGGPGPRFRHALTQEAVAATLAAPDRRRLATAALDSLESGIVAIETLDDAALEVALTLARHTGDHRRTCALLIESASRAVEIGATTAALSHLDAAETYADADALHGTVIREHRVRALALAGMAHEAIRLGEQLVIDLEAAHDRTRLHRTQLALARASGATGDWQAAAARLDGTWPDTPPASYLSFRAIVAIELDDVGRAAQLARQALEAGRGDGVVECEAHEVLGRLARRDSYFDAAVHFRHGVEAAAAHDLPLWRARSLLELGLSEATLYGRAETFELALAAAVESGAISLVAMVGYNLSNLLGGYHFAPDPAIDVAEQAIEAAEHAGAEKLLAMGWIAAGQAHGTAGRRGAALRTADQARRAAPGDAEVEALATGMCSGWSTLIAESAAAATDEYLSSLDALLTLPFRTATSPWYWGALLATIHDPDGLGARVVEEIRTMGDVPGLALVDSASTAIAAGRRGDVATAQNALTDVETFAARHPDMASRAGGMTSLIMRVLAEAALADGWGAPVDWLRDAEAVFHHSGLDAAARSCAVLLREAGAGPRRRGRARSDVPDELAAFGVTARELDVLTLLSGRLTNREIADRLSVSPKTVKSHVERLLAKTGRRDRVELGELAAEVGLG